MRSFNTIFRPALAALIVLGLHFPALAQQTNSTQLTRIQVTRLSITGRSLSGDEAAKLEQTLVTDPKNVTARISLIAYYAGQRDDPSRAKKDEQALWFISNMPDWDLLRWVIQVRLDPVLDKDYNRARELWLANLEKYNGNTAVIGNAFDFFEIYDKALAEKLIKQAAALEPTNPRWPSQFGHLLTMKMQTVTGDARQSLAAEAYEQYRLAYSGMKNAGEKTTILQRLPLAAFDAGDFKQAREWSLEILNQEAANHSPMLIDAVHHAQITLGRIALTEKNLPEARSRLALAGQTAGSPSLKSFGPNMTLAKELLEKGEREAVLKYFEECAAFWKNKDQLDQWTVLVKAGQMPRFGANLLY